MSFYQKPRFWVLVSVAVVALLILQQFWHWEVERIEVPAGHCLVLVHRWGKNLAPDEILAPDDSYKGVMQEPLAEGRHFLNPIFWSYEIHPMVNVPPDKCLVLTRKYGKAIPKERMAAGDILAQEGECGVVREPFTPGSYRINPYAYAVELKEAATVAAHQVGVHTLQVGKDPRQLQADPARSRYVVPDGYRGVKEQPVQPGVYYVNPYVETITPVDVDNHRVEFDDITFPTRDGFILKPPVFVTYRVRPNKAPELLVRLSDKGTLHQEDSSDDAKKKNEILQKIILPHIRGWVRIEGSNLEAKDFIVTQAATGDQKAVNKREQLQRTLLTKIKPQCEEIGIDILEVTLGATKPPKELAEQISDRETLRAKQERNQAKLGELKSKQTAEAATAMKQQATEKTQAETGLKVAKTQAAQKKEVGLQGLKNDLAIAQLQLEAARNEAKKVLAEGQATADVINMENESKIAGLRRAIQGFPSVQHFAQYHILSKMAPALTEIFASDDSEFAKLFATYMTQPLPVSTRRGSPTATAPPAKPASP